MKPVLQSPSSHRATRNRAFTLVEVMIGMSIGLLVMGAVCMIIVMSARTVTKITMLDDATSNTRKLQEHINKELSAAVSQTEPIRIVPTYSDLNSAGRAGCITYRTQIGSFASVPAITYASSSDITLACPSDVNVKVGDYLMIDDPNLGSGAVVLHVSDTRSAGTSGNVTITLATTIGGATTVANKTNVAANTLATIQRPRKYATVVRPDNPALSDLRYYDSVADPTAAPPFIVLSRNIDSSTRYLFVQSPADPSGGGYATEPAINWQITYLNADTATYLPGSVPSYYKTNYSEGIIMPKSGNPLSTNSYAGITTSKSTTSTTTSSTTSSTTSKSTTISTTSKSTTSTSTTSKSTTSSTTTSTTSKSTTSTTSKSTTSSTTTSTTSKSTTSTTSKSTTSTSTTSKSTTSSTTTSKSTTSTTSTTTSKSTTSKSTTSTSIPTTSIPLDG